MKLKVIFAIVIISSLFCSLRAVVVQAVQLPVEKPIRSYIRPHVVQSEIPKNTPAPEAKKDKSRQVPAVQIIPISPAPSVQPTANNIQVPENNNRPVQKQGESQTISLPPPVITAAPLSKTVPVINDQVSETIITPAPEKTVPPITFFIPSNSENYYITEGLSYRNTIFLLLTGLVFIGVGNYMVREKRHINYSKRIHERIFYEWA